MEVDIYSRDAIEKYLRDVFSDETHSGQESEGKTAVISFYDPPGHVRASTDYKPVDYSRKIKRVFQIPLHDIDIECLEEFGLSYETYLPEAEDLARFIYDAKNDGLNIICQCEYGQSRSAGCAAAIRERFYGDGIKVFADYRYYPNQLVFNKVIGALEKLHD